MRHKFAHLIVIVVLLAGCAIDRQIHRRSNLMSYLYPDGGSPQQAGGNLRLQLPLRIGIAFIPANARAYSPQYTLMPPDGEKRLIDIVRKSFAGRDWVREIVTIPSSYLEPHGGFENLSQIAQLMNVDLIALVSVDQLQASNAPGWPASLLYVSIVGEYVLPLDRSQTRTLIDMAVFHVPSRAFLLRAPGVSAITGNSTPIDAEAKLRERSLRGFELAMADLSKNLDTEVVQFKASIASGERKNIDIYTAKGESVRGGGAFGGFEALVSLLMLLLVVTLRRS